MPLSRLAQDVMGYSEVVFFRFVAVLFSARSLLRNERVFFVENDPCRFVGRAADPTRLRSQLRDHE